MPGGRHYKKGPSLKTWEIIKKELEPYKGRIKPKLTYTFYLPKDRRLLLKENLSKEEIMELAKSKDFVVWEALTKRESILKRVLKYSSNEQLKRALESNDSKVREVAAEELVKRADEKVLKEMLKNDSWAVREVAAEELVRRGVDKEVLKEMLKNDSRVVREVAAEELVKRADEKVLKEMLKNGALDIKEVAARELIKRGVDEKVLREVLKNDSRVVREVAAEELVRRGVDKGVLKEMLKNDSWVVRRIAAEELVRGEVDKGVLKEMLKNGALDIKEVAARELVKRGVDEKVLKEMLKNDSWAVREVAAEELVRRGVDKEVLKEMLRHNSWVVKRIAAEELVKRADEKVLKEMLKNDSWAVREVAAEELVRRGVDKEVLKEMLRNDSRVVREVAARELIKRGVDEKVLREVLNEVEEIQVKEMIMKELSKRNRSGEIMMTQKRLFATPDRKAIAERIEKLHKVERELRRKFKDKFVGFVVFGSTEKGYMTKESDVDYAIIAKNKEVASEFRRLLEKEGLKPCHEHYIGSINAENIEDISRLFSGLFFGNHKKLRALQREALLRVSKKEWEEVRWEIAHQQQIWEKAGERLDLNKREAEYAALLLTVPPTYEEMLRRFRISKKQH